MYKDFFHVCVFSHVLLSFWMWESQYIVCQTGNSSIFDVTDDGGTPLHFAASKRNSYIVQQK